MSHSNQEYYDTSHPHFGVTLIFNHLMFEAGLEEEERHGSLKDTEDCRHAFGGLGSDVRVFNDLTEENVKNELKKGEKKSKCELNSIKLLLKYFHSFSRRSFEKRLPLCCDHDTWS